MSIGIVSDDDFLKELGQVSEPVVGVVVDTIPKGRSDGDNNVPESLRKIIGEESVINGRDSAVKLAGMLGISASSVSAYAKGATSTTTYNEPKPAIISHINKSRHRAIKKASKTLNSALGAITQEKLDYTDAKDLSVIAKNMSGIIKDLEPPQTNESNPVNTQFVVYAPQFRDERSFDSIHVDTTDSD